MLHRRVSQRSIVSTDFRLSERTSSNSCSLFWLSVLFPSDESPLWHVQLRNVEKRAFDIDQNKAFGARHLLIFSRTLYPLAAGRLMTFSSVMTS